MSEFHSHFRGRKAEFSGRIFEAPATVFQGPPIGPQSLEDTSKPPDFPVQETA